MRVTGVSETGQLFDRLFEGFNAVVVHHEIDHLDGVLFIDRIESEKDLYTISENQRSEMVKVSCADIIRKHENSDSIDTLLGKELT